MKFAQHSRCHFCASICHPERDVIYSPAPLLTLCGYPILTLQMQYILLKFRIMPTDPENSHESFLVRGLATNVLDQANSESQQSKQTPLKLVPHSSHTIYIFGTSNKLFRNCKSDLER